MQWLRRYARPRFSEAHYRVCLGVALAIQVAFGVVYVLDVKMPPASFPHPGAEALVIMLFALGSCVFFGIPLWTAIAATWAACQTENLRKLRLSQAILSGYCTLALLPLAFIELRFISIGFIAGIVLPVLFLIDVVAAVRVRRRVLSGG